MKWLTNTNNVSIVLSAITRKFTIEFKVKANILNLSGLLN